MSVAHAQAASLFDAYGGFAAIRSVVMDFYDRVLDSDVIAHYFEDIDLARLIEHQTSFVAYLLGGPVEMAEQRLVRAHARLNISHPEFDEVKRLMAAALEAAGFRAEDTTSVLDAVEARRSLIVREDA